MINKAMEAERQEVIKDLLFLLKELRTFSVLN
jgi:hypothetical protein